ncbi:MAG: threonine synthase [Candidatus Hydrogenedentota bacterium]
MEFITKCIRCNTENDPKESFVCKRCGGNLEVIFDYKEKIGIFPEPGKGLSRYRKLLPIQTASNLPDLIIGNTPLIRPKRINEKYKIPKLFLKDEGRLPSYSFKDRASAVALAHFRESGYKEICGASTGNAASSLSCLSASIGIKPIIFVPHTAPKAKIAQLLIYGSRVFIVQGTYDDAFDLSLNAGKEFGWYNRNTGYNPFTREGKKTVSFEIYEQLKGEVPDWVVVPVGDGNILSGVEKGFYELKEFNLIKNEPKILAVQAEGSAAIFNAYKSNKPIEKTSSNTLADSISVDFPRDGDAALRAIKRSQGDAITVSDNEILSAMKELASLSGIFSEPASSASFAGCIKALDNIIDKDKKIIVLLTGCGLKDIDSAFKSVDIDSLIKIGPDIKELKNKL